MSNTELSPMQEQILQRADSIFNSISNTVSNAASFANEQIPDIAIQYVAFGRAYTTTVVLACIIFVIAWAITTYKLVKANNDDIIYPVATVGGVISLISLIVGMANVKEFMMVWFAPKIWLITEIVKLVK